MKRAGNVVRIRLSPKDSMSVIDYVAKTTDIKLSTMGISVVASIALSKILKEKRDAGELPDRFGHEYTSMMDELDSGRGVTKEKQAMATMLYEDAMGISEDRGELSEFQRRMRKESPAAPAGDWVYGYFKNGSCSPSEYLSLKKQFGLPDLPDDPPESMRP